MKLLSLEFLSKRPGRGRVLMLALAAAVATTALPAPLRTPSTYSGAPTFFR